MNKYHKNLTGNGTYHGGVNSETRKSSAIPAMPEKTANWPGPPGKTQGKSRSGGTPTTGYRGPFQHKKSGI